MDIALRYNEGFDEGGNVRAPYQAFRSRTGHNPFTPSGKLAAALTNGPLGDRYSILPVPLVLDDREYREVIAAGVTQRALALQALFFDLMSGETEVFRKTPLPIDLFPAILEQEGLAMRDLAAWWEGHSREAVRFTYAPDLVRGPDGRWLILEDNLGCVGGIVDSELVVQRLLACTGTCLHPSLARGSNLARAVCDFLARVERTPNSVDVLAVLGDECSSSDPEATRKRRVLQELGMHIVDEMQVEVAERRGLRIRDVRAIVNFSTTNRKQASVLAHDLFGRHRVPLMTAPGIAALGNKALLPFMDDIVAFYSSADPILRAAETRFCRPCLLIARVGF